MRKWLLVMSLLAAFGARAEEVDLLAPEPETTEETLPAAAPRLPDCHNQQMLQAVSEKIDSYNADNPVTSLIDRRQRALRLRFVSDYSPVPVADFASKEHRNVSDKILMVKINNGLDDSDLLLCKSDVGGSGFAPVYLLIYNDKYQHTQVDIINYQPNDSEVMNVSL